MAKLYSHKRRGWQVRYRVYFPDGSSLVKYRYAPGHADAVLIFGRCEYLEAGSRAGNLQAREIVRAKHDGLLSDSEAVLLSGGRVVLAYDLDLVLKNYESSSRVANTPYSHTVNMRRAKRLAGWLKTRPIPELTETDVKRLILARRDGTLVYRNEKTGTVRVGCSAKTVRNELGVLQQIIDEAVRLTMCDVNVARGVDVPVKTSRVRRSMKAEEIQKLIETAIANRHLCHGYAYEMVMVALYTGLRRGELRVLEWTDIDFDAQWLAVQSKTLPDGTCFTAKSGCARLTTIPDPLLLYVMSRNLPDRYLDKKNRDSLFR